jgi:flagellar biogenesis protein FliO
MMSPDVAASVFKLIGVLVLIVGGLIAFNIYAKRFFRGHAGIRGRKTVHVLESTPLGLKKSIALVKVPGRILVLGITNDRIALLERIDPNGYEAAAMEEPAGALPSFKDQLRKMSGGWQRHASDTAAMESIEGNS